MLKSLKRIDIVLTVYNQERIIERVLYGIFRNTTTPFNLILIFVGCIDRTKPRALRYIKKYKPRIMINLITKDIPNLHETKSNNIGFRLAGEDYMITIQDDMVINEYGWERRLTYPLRKFDDVLAITARSAHNIVEINKDIEEYSEQAARECNTLSRDNFAVRDIINRGPVAFRMDYLSKLNYLNEDYAPCNLDDADISLRAWKKYKWKVGAYWIDYISRREWGKTRENNAIGMVTVRSNSKNAEQINYQHGDYINGNIKHTENIRIDESEIDYKSKAVLKRPMYILFYPIRITKKDMRKSIIKIIRKLIP